MEIPIFISSFAIGSAALALWVNARFPGFGPESARGVIAHVIGAVILGQIAARTLHLALDPSALASTLAVLFGLALPTLVYAFLSAVWMIKLAQEMFGRAVR
jgi:hypothetical protein